jgi:hypothetical protein
MQKRMQTESELRLAFGADDTGTKTPVSKLKPAIARPDSIETMTTPIPKS